MALKLFERPVPEGTRRMGKDSMSPRKLLPTIALSILVLLGCTTPASVIAQVRPRAAFDLNCPSDQVEVALIEGSENLGTYGATGCGRRVRYESMCSLAGSNCKFSSSTADSGDADKK